MTPTPSAAPATERGAILDALDALNLATFNLEREPDALDFRVDFILARMRYESAKWEAMR